MRSTERWPMFFQQFYAGDKRDLIWLVQGLKPCCKFVSNSIDQAGGIIAFGIYSSRLIMQLIMQSAAVDDAYNDPFVLGTSAFRGSIDTVCRSALAVALKIASAMWWLFPPYGT